MIRQFSAGGIVFKKDKVLVVQNSAIRDKKISFWGFPKGHLEEGEKSEETALREVEEETSVKAKIVSKVGESKYFFTQGNQRIFKVVNIFLMEYLEGEPKPQQKEITKVKWFLPDQALKILSFKNDKNLLRLALKMKL